MSDKFLIENHIREALKEDIGFGDITTDFLAKPSDILEATLNTRETGVLCGAEIFKTVFKMLDENVEVKFYFKDGDLIEKDIPVASLKGSAAAILKGERTALNYVQRMSGIATVTKIYQDIVKPYGVRITDTRKTTPNFRFFEKYAVKTGGGMLHRFNLSDCAMIKDNHIKLAGSIREAVEKIRENTSHTHKIEVECDTLEQVGEALLAGADIIMLDNMPCEIMSQAVEKINKKAIVEASGGVTLDTLTEIAQTGVDVISTSAIVAGAKPLDLGLDIS